MRTEIRIAGFGGQGIVLAGAILGEAAVIADLEAVQTQSYGPESRGGAARSEVVIADSPVDYPRVTVPDVLIVLSSAAMVKYGSDRGKDTKTVVDADLVQMEVEDAERIPFTMTAEAMGKRIVANIVMLGFATNRYKLVPRDAMEKAIMKRIPKGTEELNMNAFQAGWDLADGKKPKVPKKAKKDPKGKKDAKGKKDTKGKKTGKDSKGKKPKGGKA